MPERDLELLISAARAAGEIARKAQHEPLDVVEKADGQGPVTRADLAVNAALEEELRDARADYGWLSEESPDDPHRQQAPRCFVIDPIDGTRSFIDGADTWALSLAVTEGDAVVAGVVYLPAKDRLYAAARGHGATRNGAPLRSEAGPDQLEGTKVLAPRPVTDAQHWRAPMPSFQRTLRPSLAYRMALVAEGRFPAMLTFRACWEWDVAAGALLCAEAGRAVSDQRGSTPRFNSTRRQTDGMIAATPRLHGDILNRLHTDPDEVAPPQLRP